LNVLSAVLSSGVISSFLRYPLHGIGVSGAL
jgi:hypothetical protein